MTNCKTCDIELDADNSVPRRSLCRACYRTSQRSPARRAHRAAWKARNRERMRAISRAGIAVYRALKSGLLAKPSRCERCGTAGPVEGAHSDYSKPLAVEWLCRRCHAKWDAAEPKTKALTA